MSRNMSRRRLTTPALSVQDPLSRRSVAQRQFRQAPWIVRKPGAMRFSVPAPRMRAAR